MTAFLFCLSAGMLTAHAQAERGDGRDSLPEQRMHRFAEIPNPEKEAQRLTDRLKDTLQLTDKQYEKVYKLFLKEQKERVEARMQGPRFGGNGPMRPGGGGQRSMGFGGEGFPPMMGGEEDTPVLSREERAEAMRKEAEARAEKLDKKMKKILTDEQYAKWKALPPEAPAHRPGPPKEGDEIPPMP